jgi:hypothetical protein
LHTGDSFKPSVVDKTAQRSASRIGEPNLLAPFPGDYLAFSFS